MTGPSREIGNAHRVLVDGRVEPGHDNRARIGKHANKVELGREKR
jgi:hypothetical protein